MKLLVFITAFVVALAATTSFAFEYDTVERVVAEFRLDYDAKGHIAHVNGVPWDEHIANVKEQAEDSHKRHNAFFEAGHHQRDSPRVSERVPNNQGYPTIYEGIPYGPRNWTGSSFRFDSCPGGDTGPFYTTECSGVDWLNSDEFDIINNSFYTTNYTCSAVEGRIDLYDGEGLPPILNSPMGTMRNLGKYQLYSHGQIAYNINNQRLDISCDNKWRGQPIVVSEDNFFYGLIGMSLYPATSAIGPEVNQFPLFRTYKKFRPTSNVSTFTFTQGSGVEADKDASLYRPECALVTASVFIADLYDNDTQSYVQDAVLQYQWYPDWFCCTGNSTFQKVTNDSLLPVCCQGQSVYTDYTCLWYGSSSHSDGSVSSMSSIEDAPIYESDSGASSLWSLALWIAFMWIYFTP